MFLPIRAQASHRIILMKKVALALRMKNNGIKMLMLIVSTANLTREDIGHSSFDLVKCDAANEGTALMAQNSHLKLSENGISCTKKKRGEALTPRLRLRRIIFSSGSSAAPAR